MLYHRDPAVKFSFVFFAFYETVGRCYRVAMAGRPTLSIPSDPQKVLLILKAHHDGKCLHDCGAAAGIRASSARYIIQRWGAWYEAQKASA